MSRLLYQCILLLLCGLATRQAAAQQHPNIEKGFKPEHAYSVGDLDAVNLFNGNLNVSIPIGGTYPVSETLSYGFTLAYSGNNWEYREEENVLIPTYQSPPNPPFTYGTIRWAIPYENLNAGMGWLFSLGRLIPTKFNPNAPQRTAYQAPDGSEHELFPTLHSDGLGPTNPNVTYSRGGSYIRSTAIYTNGTFTSTKLEFPDGTTKVFGTDGRLKTIEDRSGNTVTVDYYATPQAAAAGGLPAPDSTSCGSSYLAWKVTDPHRTQYVYFLPPGSGNSIFSPPFEERVCQASLAAFGGNRADYHFTYADRVISRQKVNSPIADDPAMRPSPALLVPLLTRVDLPSGSSYEMLYDIGMYKAPSAAAVGLDSDDSDVPNEVSDLALQHNPGSYSGHLIALQIPTRGRYEWDYQRFTFPPKYGQVSDPMEPSELLAPSMAAGVKEKRRIVGDGSPTATWSYAQTFLTEAPWGKTAAVITVDAPDGTTTKNYFSLFWEQGMERTKDYGAPFTRRPDMNNPYKDMYLSSITTVPGGLERRTYVTYEQDPIENFADSLSCNRRLQSRMTVFEDGSETKEAHSSFDGLGHYRTTLTTGTAGPVKRTITRNYNPNLAANGTLPTTAPWLTETYGVAETMDLDSNDVVVSKSRVEVCFDTSNGRLLRKRSVRNAAPSNIDLLTIYKDEDKNGAYEDGNVSQEEYYGGDDSVLPQNFSTCVDSPGVPTYRLLHEHEFGSRKATQYDGWPGFKVLDLTIDAFSGLPSATRDVAGVGTTLTYDLLGRLTSIAPSSAAEKRVKSNYVYTEATAAVGPSVRIHHECPAVSQATCSAANLPEARYYYDFLGRLVQQRTSMGSAGTSAWSASTFTYDIAGRRKTSSVPMGVSSGNRSSITPPGFTTWDYDTLGRTTKITQPDSSALDFVYSGSGIVSRTAKILTKDGESSVTTEERSDAFGRLIEVIEDSTGAQLRTFYGYDVGDRLIKVTDGYPSVQTRVFDYDGAGLLKTEDHPESDATSYRYDARGHVTRRISGSTATGSTLIFDYDSAERLLKVHHDADGEASNPETILKEFTYGTSGTRLGRLWTAKRYNYDPDLGGTGIATVKETFTYDTSGLLSSKQTLVGLPGTSMQTFSDTYTYDDLGALKTVSYPSCPNCGFLSRTVENFYDHGYLRSVAGYASNIVYHPNGMWAQFNRPKANVSDAPMTEAQTLAANQMPRPASRSVSGHCTGFSITGPVSKTVNPGDDSNLSVTAPAGSTFQWYAGNTEISNQTASSLHVAVMETTSYWVRVGKDGCTIDSPVAVVTVSECGTPSISAPGSVKLGRSASASVTESGTYLWSITNGTIDNNTSTQQAVQFTAFCSGNVTLTVAFTPACGGNTVQLTKVVPIDVPTVTLNAAPSTIAPGGTSTLTVGVSGVGPWAIAWADHLSPLDVTGSANIPVSPGGTTTYEVAQVNGCAMNAWAATTVTVTPPAPLTTTATQSGAASVLVSWTIPAGATIESYRVERCTSSCTAGGAWSFIGSTTAMTFIDGGVVASGAYVYRVVSVTAGTYSTTASPPDFASTYAFTDHPLATLGAQRISHVSELRAAVNALRGAAGLSAYSFTDTLSAGLSPKALYLNELLSAMNPARTAFGRPVVAFTAPAPAAGGLPLAAHVNELRGGVQ